jgi:hypothetical protein
LLFYLKYFPYSNIIFLQNKIVLNIDTIEQEYLKGPIQKPN